MPIIIPINGRGFMNQGSTLGLCLWIALWILGWGMTLGCRPMSYIKLLKGGFIKVIKGDTRCLDHSPKP